MFRVEREFQILDLSLAPPQLSDEPCPWRPNGKTNSLRSSHRRLSPKMGNFIVQNLILW
jgi:hypothetical protein